MFVCRGFELSLTSNRVRLASLVNFNFGLPAEGFEPPTYGLQNRCTTTVLSRHGSAHIITMRAAEGLPKSIANPAGRRLRRRSGRQFLAQ